MLGHGAFLKKKKKKGGGVGVSLALLLLGRKACDLNRVDSDAVGDDVMIVVYFFMFFCFLPCLTLGFSLGGVGGFSEDWYLVD